MIDAVWLTGGYQTDWNSRADAELFRQLKLVVVQDFFPSPLWECADYRLPCPAFAEREGSYVNCDQRLQSFTWAIRPPSGVLDEAQIFWRMLNRLGLYRSAVVRQEISSQYDYFREASNVPATGVELGLREQAAECMPTGTS
jgi:anaerobic selenocysteine-containing dehydrogenase